MKMYHSANYPYGGEAASRFDPARPTSLLCQKRGGGYQLPDAMYTAPFRTSEAELAPRVPLSVAQWPMHVTVCGAPPGARGWACLTMFGLRGSLTTAKAGEAAGGTFLPHLYGWMVHVHLWETCREAVWAHQH